MIFREDCYDALVKNFDIANFDCLKFVAVKAIGLAIIVGSAILKVP